MLQILYWHCVLFQMILDEGRNTNTLPVDNVFSCLYDIVAMGIAKHANG